MLQDTQICWSEQLIVVFTLIPSNEREEKYTSYQNVQTKKAPSFYIITILPSNCHNLYSTVKNVSCHELGGYISPPIFLCTENNVVFCLIQFVAFLIKPNCWEINKRFTMPLKWNHKSFIGLQIKTSPPHMKISKIIQ